MPKNDPNTNKRKPDSSAGGGRKKKANCTANVAKVANIATFKGSTREEKLLHSLAELHSLNISEPTKKLACKQAGYGSVESKAIRGCFQKNGQLSTEGLVEFPTKDTIKITEKGLGHVGHVESKMSLEELRERLIEMLFNENEAKVVRALYDGEWHSVADLLEATGYNNVETKAVREPIGMLKKNGFLKEEGKGKNNKKYRLTDKAFPAGRN